MIWFEDAKIRIFGNRGKVKGERGKKLFFK